MEEENQAFQPEVIKEERDNEDIIQEIREKRNGRDIKTSDIITMQCILCILLAIAVVVINMLLPQVSEQIIYKYKSESMAESEINDMLVSIVSKISDFVNSSPNDRV